VARSLERVVACVPGQASLLAALAVIRSGAREMARLVSTENLGPERRFLGSARQFSGRMTAELGEAVCLQRPRVEVAHARRGVTVKAGRHRVRARRAIVAPTEDRRPQSAASPPLRPATTT
jgi:hypothetical protein